MVNNNSIILDFLSVINLDFLSFYIDYAIIVILLSLSAITIAIFTVSIWDIVYFSGRKLGDVGKAVLTGASAGLANVLGQRLLGGGQNNNDNKSSDNKSGNNSTNNSGNGSGDTSNNSSGNGSQGK